MSDEQYMTQCLDLALKGMGAAAPNPLVGCVIVHNDTVIGRGAHLIYGQAHAEVNAIDSVADRSLLRDSTLYVNLEPCSHWGKTPPCCDRIIAEGIPRVVVGMIDPFAQVCGQGISRLREAGIDVVVGVLGDQCRDLNRRFITFQTRLRPYVILKWAQTSDGYLDNNRDASTPPTWMTGPECRRLVHRWRGEEAAIMAGTNTVLRDNPSLTVREVPGRNPARVVIDRNLRLDNGFRIFDNNARILFYTDTGNGGKARQLHPAVEAHELDFRQEILPQLLASLHREGIQSLIVEGGGLLLASFIESRLWDEARVFTAGMTVADLKGGRPTPPLGTKAPALDQEPVSEQPVDGTKLAVYRNEYSR